jgi:hypothetical protein
MVALFKRTAVQVEQTQQGNLDWKWVPNATNLMVSLVQGKGTATWIYTYIKTFPVYLFVCSPKHDSMIVRQSQFIQI